MQIKQGPLRRWGPQPPKNCKALSQTHREGNQGSRCPSAHPLTHLPGNGHFINRPGINCLKEHCSCPCRCHVLSKGAPASHRHNAGVSSRGHKRRRAWELLLGAQDQEVLGPAEQLRASWDSSNAQGPARNGGASSSSPHKHYQSHRVPQAPATEVSMFPGDPRNCTRHR